MKFLFLFGWLGAWAMDGVQVGDSLSYKCHGIYDPYTITQTVQTIDPEKKIIVIETIDTNYMPHESPRVRKSTQTLTFEKYENSYQYQESSCVGFSSENYMRIDAIERKVIPAGDFKNACHLITFNAKGHKIYSSMFYSKEVPLSGVIARYTIGSSGVLDCCELASYKKVSP